MKEMQTVDNGTLELMFDEIKEKLKSQLESVKEIENKASNTINFVGIITGLSVTGIQVLPKSEEFRLTDLNDIIIFSIYCLGIIFFLISLVFAFSAYKVYKFRSDPDPKSLIEKYFYHSRNEVMGQLLDNFAISHFENSKIMTRKARFITYAFFCFIVGLVLISFSMINYVILRLGANI